MPTNIYQFFLSTVTNLPDPQPIRRYSGLQNRSAPTNPLALETNLVLSAKARAALLARHLQTLESLRLMPWPSLDGLERVRYRRSVRSTNNTNLLEAVWLIATKSDHLVLLTDQYWVSHFSTNWFTDLEKLIWSRELQDLLTFLGSNPTNRAPWPYAELRYWHQQPLQGIPILIRQAYGAAWFGHTNEAARLIGLALSHDLTGEWFERMVVNEAEKAYDKLLKLFETDAARSVIAAACERFGKTYPQSQHSRQINDYAATLRMQVAEFPKLMAATVENPDALPPNERAEYFLARFPDIQPRSHFSSDPDPRPQLDQKLVHLGYAALPAAIEHLSDRRLTRWPAGQGGRPRYVFRVQDIALRCIEEITQVRFARRGVELFSEQPVTAREKVAAEALNWWIQHGNQSPLEGQIAGLDQLPLYERIPRLEKLTRENPGKIDPLSYLRKWAAAINDPQEKWPLAEPLARQGDLSLLPILRERVDKKLAGSFDVLFRYGVAEDYAVCRRAEWRYWADTQMFVGSYVGMGLLSQLARNTREGETNFLAVPLLVDLLERRVLLPPQSTMPGPRPLSSSEQALAHLVRLTGFPAPYDSNATAEARSTAMDRWLQGWVQAGKAQFLAKHPETGPVFAVEKEITAQRWVASEQWADVHAANRGAPVVYEIPRATVAALLKSGALSGKAVGDAQFLRFTTEQAEHDWFNNAAPGVLAPSRSRPARVPAMRVYIAGGAWLDSSNRLWTCWKNSTAWPAIFNGKSWQLFPENDFPATWKTCPGFVSAMVGAQGAMFFVDGDSQCVLRDASGWLCREDFWRLVREYPERLRRSLPWPEAFQDLSQRSLLKDAEGNIWYAKPDAGIMVLHGGKILSSVWPDNLSGYYMGAKPAQLTVLGNGVSVLAHDGGDRVAVFSIQNDSLVKHEFRIPYTTSLDARTFHDSRAWTWLRNSSKSVALDKNGQLITNHIGRVLLEDAQNGLWFMKDTTAPQSTIFRWIPGKPELQLRVPNLTGQFAVAPNGTAWFTAHANLLVRVGMQDDALVILEKWEVPSSNSGLIWCDGESRVWASAPGTSHGSLLRCYPMR